MVDAGGTFLLCPLPRDRVNNDTKFYSIAFERREQFGDHEVDGRNCNVK